MGWFWGSKKAEEHSKPKKICCACPETKELRDLCIAEKGQDQCQELIEKHKECLRKEGFKV